MGREYRLFLKHMPVKLPLLKRELAIPNTNFCTNPYGYDDPHSFDFLWFHAIVTSGKYS